MSVDLVQNVFRPSSLWVPVRVRERRDLTTATVTAELAAGTDDTPAMPAFPWRAAEWVAGQGNTARFLLNTVTVALGPYRVLLRLQDAPEDLVLVADGLLWVH